jgi:uncharacterized DUF497 family protein
MALDRPDYQKTTRHRGLRKKHDRLFMVYKISLYILFIGGTLFMPISYNALKNETNIRERGLSFEAVRDMDMTKALIIEDIRKAYEERRFQALGLIEERLHMLVFTPRGEKMQVISLRKANPREIRIYEQAH